MAAAWQLYWQLMWAIWGKPILALELVAFTGAVLLFLAGLITLSLPRTGAALAGVACLFLCPYYAVAVPATITTLQDPSVRVDAFAAFVAFIPPALVLASACLAAVVLARSVADLFRRG